MRLMLRVLALTAAFIPPVELATAQQPVVSAGQYVGTMLSTANPTSWSIVSAIPTIASTYFAVSGSGIITVTTAGATALAGQTGTVLLTLQATNSAGAGNTAVATISYAAGNFTFDSAGTNGTAGWSVGMNIEGVSYFTNNPMYADLMNQVDSNNGTWDNTANPSIAASLDVTGAPTVAGTGRFPMYASGTYTLTWTGSGSFIAFPSTVCTLGATTILSNTGLASQTNSAPFTSTGSLTLPGGATSFCTLFTTPPTTNIHLLAGTALTVGGIWYQPFVLGLAPFSMLRFMDALGTNTFTPAVDWVQRTSNTPGMSRSATHTGTGMAYEDIISLANLTGKDIWINIPISATDDFVCRLARLFRYGESGANGNGVNCSTTAATTGPYSSAPINPKSRIYVELSNEVWNFGFAQITYAICMATGFEGDGVTPCPNVVGLGGGAVVNGSGVVVSFNNHIFSNIASNALNSGTTNWSTGVNRGDNLLQLLSYRDGLIFKQVFSGHQQQIFNIHNVQAAGPSEVDFSLTTMNSSPFGPVSSYLDALAFAPYITLDSENTVCDTVADCTGSMLSQLICGGTSLANTCTWIDNDITESKKFGLGTRLSGTGGIIMYEGGQGLTGTGPISLASQTGTAMYVVYKNFMTLWDSQVGRANPAVFFTNMSGWSQLQGLYWATLLNIQDPGSQKYDALISSVLIPGDVNMDGVVNAADCSIIKNNINQTFATVYGSATAFWQQGDVNHDGVINAADEAIVNSHLSSGSCP
jgi:Dockerin type I domain